MADTEGRYMIPWTLVFRVATLIILVFSGMSMEQVTRVVHQVERKTEHLAHTTEEVQQQTAAVQEATTQVKERTKVLERTVADTNEKVTQNQAVLTQHGTLSVEHTAMFAHLAPLFQDIVHRQHSLLSLLSTVTQTQRTLLEQQHRREESLGAQMDQLLAVLTQTQGNLGEAVAFHAALQQQVEGLLALHRQLLEQCPGPATPP